MTKRAKYDQVFILRITRAMSDQLHQLAPRAIAAFIRTAIEHHLTQAERTNESE
jgi:predicted DNA-binding protein